MGACFNGRLAGWCGCKGSKYSSLTHSHNFLVVSRSWQNFTKSASLLFIFRDWRWSAPIFSPNLVLPIHTQRLPPIHKNPTPTNALGRKRYPPSSTYMSSQTSTIGWCCCDWQRGVSIPSFPILLSSLLENLQSPDDGVKDFCCPTQKANSL